MARYLLLALNGPTDGDGDEKEYNSWYDKIHLPDIRALDGVTSAKRFKVVDSPQPWPYVAAYEIETDDLPALMQAMEHEPRPFSPKFDRSKSSHIIAVEINE